MLSVLRTALVASAVLTFAPVVFAKGPASPAPGDKAPAICRTWYPDCDKDGFGDETQPLVSCINPTITNPGACPWRRSGEDCNDADTTINPDAPEDASRPPDGKDNDCDGYVDIDCDGLARGANPHLTLESPSRGLATTATSAAVTGFVLPGSDGTPIVSVMLEGTQASLTACSAEGGVRFSATLPLATGLHTLEVMATDSAGRRDVAYTSYERADTFQEVLDAPLSRSFTALLNQGSWNLLADAMEGLLDATELEAALFAANPLVEESGTASCLDSYSITANATAYSHDDVEVSFTVHEGVIHTTARLVAPYIAAEGTGVYDLAWNCGGFGDTVSLTGEASFDEVFASADGYLTLTKGQLGISFANVVVDARGPIISVTANDWFYDWLLDLFETELELEVQAFLEETLDVFVSTSLGPVLASELNALDLSYPVPMGDVTYDVTLGYDTLEVREQSVVLSFSMLLDYPPHAALPEHPGALWRSDAFSYTTEPTFAMKTPLNFFNSALQALFEGGTLEIARTLSDAPLVTGESHLLLPPVVMEASLPYLLELSLGDALVSLSVEDEEGSVTPVEVALSATIPLGLTPYADGKVLYFDIAFGDVSLAYDSLGDDPLPAELTPVVTSALEAIAADLLLEVEGYLESLQLSYLDIPLEITELSLEPDAMNQAMLSLEGEAYYTGM